MFPDTAFQWQGKKMKKKICYYEEKLVLDIENEKKRSHHGKLEENITSLFLISCVWLILNEDI